MHFLQITIDIDKYFLIEYNDVVIAAMNDPESSREDKQKMIMAFMEVRGTTLCRC